MDVSVVSRALNPRPDRHAVIRDETRQHILETAQRMGYRPNRQAAFMKKGRSATILAFLPGIPNRLCADLMFGMAEQACQDNFPINFFFGNHSREFGQFLHESKNIGHCGIITYPPTKMPDEMRRELDAYHRRGNSILILNVLSNTAMQSLADDYRDIPQLNIDDDYGGRLAARHLAGRGCRTLFYWRGRSHFAVRHAGFLAGAAEAGLAVADLDNDGLSALGGTDGRAGVFAACDVDALALMARLAARGVTVGDRVRVVGFDDMVEGAAFEPSLTTVHQPTRREGARAVEKLIRMIFGDREESECLRPHLVVRESTGGRRPDPADAASEEIET